MSVQTRIAFVRLFLSEVEKAVKQKRKSSNVVSIFDLIDRAAKMKIVSLHEGVALVKFVNGEKLETYQENDNDVKFGYSLVPKSKHHFIYPLPQSFATMLLSLP